MDFRRLRITQSAETNTAHQEAYIQKNHPSKTGEMKTFPDEEFVAIRPALQKNTKGSLSGCYGRNLDSNSYPHEEMKSTGKGDYTNIKAYK